MKPRLLVIALVSIAVLMAEAPVASARGHNGDPFAELLIDGFEVQPATGKFQRFQVRCPTGYSAIVGTLREIPPGVAVGTSTASGPSGRIWTFEIENASGNKLDIAVQVRCVKDIVFEQKTASVSVQPQTAAEAKAKCSNGFRAIGRGEHVSSPGPPDDDDFAAFFSVYLVTFGIDELDVGITDVFDALDYYEYLICAKAAAQDDKAGKKPKLKTKTVKGSVDADAFNFAQIDLKCPRGYSPTTPSFGPLPDGVKGFADIPGTKTTQPVRFLNTSPDKQHLEGSLLCITVR